MHDVAAGEAGSRTASKSMADGRSLGSLTRQAAMKLRKFSLHLAGSASVGGGLVGINCTWTFTTQTTLGAAMRTYGTDRGCVRAHVRAAHGRD